MERSIPNRWARARKLGAPAPLFRNQWQPVATAVGGPRPAGWPLRAAAYQLGGGLSPAVRLCLSWKSRAGPKSEQRHGIKHRDGKPVVPFATWVVRGSRRHGGAN